MERLGSLAVVLALGALAGLPAPGPPCVPAGETTTVSAARPPLGQAGDPVGAEWTGGGTGDPQAWEDDAFGGDDHLGAASGADPATVDIENKNGNLSGPNGVVQNVGWEGDCIEVYFCWRYRFAVTICAGSSSVVGAGGSGTGQSTSECWAVWRHGYKYSGRTKVCPC